MLLLLAAAVSVAQADSALATEAAERGQWAAIGAAAAPDAFLYAPTRVAAVPFLARLPEPAAEDRLTWRPAHTITSCDTTLGYSAGPWSRTGHSGWYGMLWRKMPDRWRWINEQGHEGGPAADAGREDDEAACPGPAGSIKPPADTPGVAIPVATLKTGAMASLIEASDGPLPLTLTLTLTLGEPDGQGGSADRSLVWRTNPVLGGRPGAHLLRLWSWEGRGYRLVVLDLSAGD